MVLSWRHYIKPHFSYLYENILIKFFIWLLNHSYSPEKLNSIEWSLKTGLLEGISTANLKTLSTRLLFENRSEIEECTPVYSEPSFEARLNIFVIFMNKESSHCSLATIEVFVSTPNCTVNLPLMKLKLNWSNCMSTLKNADDVILLACLNYSWHIIELTCHIVYRAKW